MARIRTIKPEFPHSESMGRVSRESRLCFILLFTLADDEGRLRGNSRMLASLLFPYDDDAKKHIDTWLSELDREGCITRYEVDGTQYLEISNWSEHQKIDRPSKSKIPPPSDDSRTIANTREPSSLDQGRDQGMDQGEELDHGEDAAEDDSPVFISIPLTGKQTHKITESKVAFYREHYPATDVEQELRKMVVWCDANPTKRKTKRGVSAFIASWLSRAQDSAGQRTPATATPRIAHPQTFAERDEAARRKRWEEMTGQKWPDSQDSNTIDITPTTLELQHGPSD